VLVSRDEIQPTGGERRVARIGQVVRLEADATRQPLGEIGEEGTLGLGELDAIDRSPGLGVAEVAEEPQALRLGLNQERDVRALEADEVADVDGARDEQRLLQGLA
jgi:hypothetical protein